MSIIYVNVENVRPPEWATTHILTPDIRLLYRSILSYGWLYPLIVRKEDMTIIDGSSRWMVASESDDILVDGKIPITVVDCDEANAILMHIRLNRAKGSIVAKRLSRAIQRLNDLGYTDEVQIRTALMMTPDEYEVLSEPRLLKNKKLVTHEYSRAWVPIEVAPESVQKSSEMTFERPPTPDA